MASIGQCRDALVVKMGSVSGLNAVARLRQVHPPTALVEFGGGPYHEAMGLGAPVWRFNVSVLVTLDDLAAAQTALDSYTDISGAGSIPAALEADRSLGGVVQDCVVREAGEYQRMNVEGIDYLGVRLWVEIRP